MKRLLLAGCILVAACGGARVRDEAVKGDEKPTWASETEGARRSPGLLPLWVKPDGTLLVELTPRQLDVDHAMGLRLGSALEPFLGWFAMIPVDWPFLIRFHRAGGRVLVLRRSALMQGDASQAELVDLATTPTVLAALPIAVEDAKRGLLVELTPLLTSDIGALGRRLRDVYGPDARPELDAERSYVERAEAYPHNLELDVLQTFHVDAMPAVGGAALTDPTNPSVRLHVSIYALPDPPMAPRAGDDRVGYFGALHKRLDRNATDHNLVFHIARRRLVKRHPERAVSDPVEPIRYVIDPAMPRELVPIIKGAVLAWLPALEAAGFSNALTVEEAPRDRPWRPADLDTTAIVWSPGYASAVGYGALHADPRTGEILDADLILGSEVMRATVDPTGALTPDQGGPAGDGACEAQGGAARGLLLQAALTGTRASPEVVEAVMRQLVIHEVGHTLGLRHNFRASNAIANDRLQDRGYVRAHGLGASVMDYVPLNIAADPARQVADIVSHDIGPYDMWAIRYGYTAFATPEAEAAGLAAITETSNQPEHEFGTDEDVPWSGVSSDPTARRWDLGADATAFAAGTIAGIDHALPSLPERIAAEPNGFVPVRAAVTELLRWRHGAVRDELAWVGGVIAVRDHRGQPGRRPPLRGTPPAQQRRALALVIDAELGERAARLPASLVAELAPWRGGLHDGTNGDRSGPGEWAHYPLHEVLLAQQTNTIDLLLDAGRLARVLDIAAEAPAPAEALQLSELFETVDAAITAELRGRPRAIDSFRRALQMAWIDRLSRLVLVAEPPAPPASAGFGWLLERNPLPPARMPDDARALARATLERIATHLDRQLRVGGTRDAATRAHLGEARARIRRTLDARLDAPR